MKTLKELLSRRNEVIADLKDSTIIERLQEDVLGTISKRATTVFQNQADHGAKLIYTVKISIIGLLAKDFIKKDTNETHTYNSFSENILALPSTEELVKYITSEFNKTGFYTLESSLEDDCGMYFSEKYLIVSETKIDPKNIADKDIIDF